MPIKRDLVRFYFIAALPPGSGFGKTRKAIKMQKIKIAELLGKMTKEEREQVVEDVNDIYKACMKVMEGKSYLSALIFVKDWEKKILLTLQEEV